MVDGSCSQQYLSDCSALTQTVEAATTVGEENTILLTVYDLDECPGYTPGCPPDPTGAWCDDPGYDRIGGSPAMAWQGVVSVEAGSNTCEGNVVDVATAQFDTPGLHTVTCTITDTGQYVDDGGLITINYAVKPAAPACPRSRGTFWGCESLAGGCGSCEGDLPQPDLREPFIAVVPPGLGPGYDGGNAGSAGCPKDTIKLYDTCEGIYALYHNRCGGCCRFFVNEILAPEQEFAVFRCGDATITWVPPGQGGQGDGMDASGSIEFTATYPDGSCSTFEVALPTVEMGFTTGDQGPSTVVAADGSVTTFVRDVETGAIESITLPNGETWRYVVEDGNITEVTRPDNTVVELEYEGGRLTTVSGPSPREITYTYNQDGTLASASNGSRTLAYTYPASRKIVVAEASADPDLVTEYDYGDEEEFTTTITRAGTPDQVTVYSFLDSGNGKGLLDTVTDSVEGVTGYNFNSSTGRLISVTGPDGIVTAYDYNSKGAIASMQGWRWPVARSSTGTGTAHPTRRQSGS